MERERAVASYKGVIIYLEYVIVHSAILSQLLGSYSPFRPFWRGRWKLQWLHASA